MWKHLQPFGHRRSNSKRGKNRDRNPRPRANTNLVDERSPAIPRSSATTQSPPQPVPSPRSGPSTHRAMTAATYSEPNPPQAPTKASLKTWWNHFTFAQKAKREADERRHEWEKKGNPALAGQGGHVFGKPLKDSLAYASVQISTANANGELYVWGYIPVVVAKCGLYLKENATEIEGTFRVPGSNKRMRDLQTAFETPPRYGKDLDWKHEPYTAHDVASVFRRYLTQMPEPVIPHDMYHHFRDAIAKKPFNRDEVIARYKRLIRSLPRPNQYLLLYVLDLLNVFARKSEKNLMTAKNLAVIFRPAVLSHPTHELSPQDQHLSQDVLEFLIEHQDWFMLDIAPAAGGGRSGGPPLHVEPVDMMINTDGDAEGWALLDQDERTGSRRIVRRRTTSERPGDAIPRAKVDPDDLSPVIETPPSRGESVVTVSRSRTMPSSKAHHHGRSNHHGDDEPHPRVLRKQKRVSAQPPPRPGVGG